MILRKPLGSRPIYKNQADFFRKATNRKKLKCPGNGMWTSMPGNESLYGPPHGTREPPRGTVRIAGERGGSIVFTPHSPPPPFKPHSHSVHMPSMHRSCAIHVLFTCNTCADRVPSMHCSRAIHVAITCHPCPIHVLITCHPCPVHVPLTR